MICKTPHLDQLAEEGTVFDHAYCTTPICSPARASLQTGLYPFKHGMQTNIFQHGCMTHELRDDESLLSRRLQQAGYIPAYTGKWHLGYDHEDEFYQNHYPEIDLHYGDVSYPHRYTKATAVPSDFGYLADDFPGHGGGGQNYPQFQDYLQTNGLDPKSTVHTQSEHMVEVCGDEQATVDWMLTDRAMNIVRSLKSSQKPFFLMLNFWGPHSPYHIPTRFLDLYRDQELPEWLSFDADQTGKPSIHSIKRDPNRSWAEIEEELRYYYAYVSFIDEQVGRLITMLKDEGLYDETAIIFSADHGDSLGIHSGLFDKGLFMYEDTTSIPLIVRLPEAEAGRSASMIGTCDIYSTILDLAGLPVEQQSRHGRSVVPLVIGPPPLRWPEYAVTECSGIGHVLHSSRMICDQRWKYVFNCGALDELYDLQSDPCELVNIARDPVHRDTLLNMQHALRDWLEEKGDGLLYAFKRLREFCD